LAVDMTDRSAVEEAAVTVEREFGRLDVLVNNAGYLEKWLPLAETDPDEWWRTWEVNLRGCYLMDRAFIPLLLKGGDKTIVTVTSAGGLSKRRVCPSGWTAGMLMRGYSPGASAYQGSKAAQIRLNNHIMVDYGDQVCLKPRLEV
jgi:NAD(P)-dependent dehydrogenase (short-subunit alcohol dehydrogenase family)